MTVTTTATNISYVGNGSVKVFAYPFKIQDDDDIVVKLAGATQTSGYTVDGVGDANGGNVTFDSAPGGGVVVEFLRDVRPLLQETDLVGFGKNQIQAIEDICDRIVMAYQELDYDAGGDVIVTSNPLGVLSPDQFGGVGDGAANDYVALQACIDEAVATKSAVYLPGGKEWRYETPLNNIGGLLIFGAGMEAQSKLKPDGCHGFHVTGQTSALDGRVTMRDFVIDGNNTAGGNDAILIEDGGGAYPSYHFSLTNLRIQQMSGRGVVNERQFFTKLDNVLVGNGGGNAFEMAGGNTTTLINCYAADVVEGAIGFRMYNGGMLISCNGIDGEGTWAEFGSTVAEDGKNIAGTVALVGCNIEQFGDVGIRQKYSGSIHLIGRNTFLAKSSGEFDYYIKSETGSDTMWIGEGTTFTSLGATQRHAAAIYATGAVWSGGAGINFTPDGTTVITPASIQSKRDGALQRIYIPNLEVDDLKTDGVAKGSTNNNQSFTISDTNIGKFAFFNNNTSYTVTLPGSGDLDFPVGFTTELVNHNSVFGTGCSVATVSGVTLFYEMGSGRYPLSFASGASVKLPIGCTAELFRYSASAWFLRTNVGDAPRLNKVTTVSSSPYTVLRSDHELHVDTTSAAITLNLENIVESHTGRQIVVVDTAGNAATNNITITPFAGDSIRGAANLVISANYGKEELTCDGQTNGQWV